MSTDVDMLLLIINGYLTFKPEEPIGSSHMSILVGYLLKIIQPSNVLNTCKNNNKKTIVWYYFKTNYKLLNYTYTKICINSTKYLDYNKYYIIGNRRILFSVDIKNNNNCAMQIDTLHCFQAI